MQKKNTAESEYGPLAVLDVDHLRRAAGNNRSLMRQLLEMLRLEIPQRERQLRRAFDLSDTDEILNIAHQLQGSAAYIGARQIEYAAKRLEISLKKGETIEPALAQLLACFNRLLNRLLEECDSTLTCAPDN